MLAQNSGVPGRGFGLPGYFRLSFSVERDHPALGSRLCPCLRALNHLHSAAPVRWLLYNTLFALALLAMLPNLIWRMRRRGGYGANFRQRFGRYTAEQLKRFGDGGAIWIHAVSVGEVYVAGQLMRALRERQPAIRFVLSTTSSTGCCEALNVVCSADSLIYNPLDFPLFVKRALAAIRPAAFILVETELWPNTIRACARRNIPLLLVNGRMSDRTANSYRRLRFWFGSGPPLPAPALQSQLDATAIWLPGPTGPRLP